MGSTEISYSMTNDAYVHNLKKQEHIVHRRQRVQSHTLLSHILSVAYTSPHPPTMASILRHKEPKGDHYNTQLTHALLKGNWADATAGNAPNGTALSWSELFRKWGKHTGGSEYISVALSIYADTSGHLLIPRHLAAAPPTGYLPSLSLVTVNGQFDIHQSSCRPQYTPNRASKCKCPRFIILKRRNHHDISFKLVIRPRASSPSTKREDIRDRTHRFLLQGY